MMEYDIDIEEHDVLSKVKINSMVPDLTIVKNEIVNSECQDEDCMVIDNQQYEECQDDYNSYFDHSASSPFEDIQIETNMLTEHEGPWVNKIIVGNKPNSSHSTSESAEYILRRDNHGVYDSVLWLEDWGPRLERSERFCKECLILFNTSNSLESHIMSAHSLLVPCVVGRNKAIKSTSRSGQRILNDVNNQQTHLHSKSLDLKKLCNHCNEYFTDEDSLFQHLYQVLPNDFNTQNCSNKSDSKQNVTLEPLVYSCFICSCHFALQHSAYRHATLNHKLSGIYSKQPFNPQCCFCKDRFQPEHYNFHIKKMHKEMYWKRAVMNENSNAKLAVNVQTKTQKDEIKTSVAKKSTKARMAVFKCKLCLLHFTSIFKASNHLRRCNGITSKKINYLIRNCKFCNLKFKKQDLMQHEKVHKFANFKVLEANMKKRILYKCQKCNLYYKTAMNKGHESRYCNFNYKYWCDICKINLCRKWKSNHIQNHKVDRYLKADFILLDGIDPSALDVVRSDGDTTMITTIYYCNKCGCCVNSHQVVFKHINGSCKNISSSRVICSYCGLKFFKYSFKTHLRCHRKKFNLNLCKFLLLPNMKPIKPVIPKYVSCNKCGVYIINSTIQHYCSNKFIQCDKCNKKFGTKDYELHRAFHEYSLDSTKSKQVTIPIECNKKNTHEGDVNKKEWIKKLYMKSKKGNIPIEDDNKNAPREDVVKKEWVKKHYIIPKQFDNKLYMCPVCSSLTDSVLGMKRHLNYHAIPKKIKNTYCNYCKLKFDCTCIGRHEKLHKTNKFIKSKVKIIKLSPTNTNVFNYKTEVATTRDKPKIVFYKCTKCNCAFPRQMYSENHICTKVKLKMCERCNLHFPAKDIYLHNILHKKTPRMVDYLSIIDYHPKDNTEQSNKETTEIKTQVCKCPCGYQSSIEHLLEHYESCAVAKKFPKILAEIKAAQDLNECDDTSDSLLDEKVELVKRPTENTLFKCGLCKTLFLLNSTIIKHLNYCTGNNVGVKCNGCGLVYHSLEINRHKLKKNCTVLAKSKKIIEVSKNVANVLRTVYKCDKCKVYFMTKDSLIEHSSNDHKIENSDLCKSCNLRFIDLDSHYLAHHVEIHLKFKDLRIVTHNKDNSENLNCKAVFKIKPKRPIFKARRYVETNSDFDSESKSIKELRTLYKCAKCLMHFVQWSELFAHVLETTHKSNGDVDEILARCGFCDKSFRESSLPMHLEMHHKTRKQIDFIIDTEISSSRIIDYMATLKSDGSDPVARAICDVSLRLRSEASEVKMNIDNELDNASEGDNYVNGCGTEKLGSFEETVIVESIEKEKFNVDNKVNKASGEDNINVNEHGTGKLGSFDEETIIMESVEKERKNVDNKVIVNGCGTKNSGTFEEVILGSVEKDKMNVDKKLNKASGDNNVNGYSTDQLGTFKEVIMDKEKMHVDNKVKKTSGGDNNLNGYGTEKLGSFDEDVIILD